MKRRTIAMFAGLLAICGGALFAKPAGEDRIKDPSTAPAKKDGDKPVSPLDFKVKNIDGKEMNLADYKGKVVLLVNVASKCGNTKQYAALETMYEKYKDQGLVIIGVPANNFGGQEPGTEAEIKEFCSSTYNV
jgi:glutathione peroxidase